MKLFHFLKIKPQRDFFSLKDLTSMRLFHFKRFNLNKTINADMASLVQEQLLNISIVYQHLENTESEDRFWQTFLKIATTKKPPVRLPNTWW